MSKPHVFLALPSYVNGPDSWRIAVAATLDATDGTCEVFRSVAEGSLLANVFNSLWCDALNSRENDRLTHFAMLHSDVCPEPGWLDILVREQEGTGADVLSVVIPIKDGRGVTSTAVDNPDNPWEPLRRITLREAYQLPETFNADDAGHPGHRLLVNTGCWICRLDRPWCENVLFTVQDRISQSYAGRFSPQVISEDWNFSRQVQDAGGRVLATRKVRVIHRGVASYANDRPWGTWERDEAYNVRPERELLAA